MARWGGALTIDLRGWVDGRSLVNHAQPIHLTASGATVLMTVRHVADPIIYLEKLTQLHKNVVFSWRTPELVRVQAENAFNAGAGLGWAGH